jgi:hypothetical protein
MMLIVVDATRRRALGWQNCLPLVRSLAPLMHGVQRYSRARSACVPRGTSSCPAIGGSQLAVFQWLQPITLRCAASRTPCRRGTGGGRAMQIATPNVARGGYFAAHRPCSRPEGHSIAGPSPQSLPGIAGTWQPRTRCIACEQAATLVRFRGCGLEDRRPKEWPDCAC